MAQSKNPPPYAEEWVAAETLSGGRSVLSGSIHDIRKQFDEQFTALKQLLPPPDYRVSKEDFQTPDGVSVRVYTPAELGPDAPTGLYIHSGGWACGSIEHEDHLCRQLCLDVPCRLVSVEYRLAPEHSFPAALDDCVSAYKWMVCNTELTSNAFFIVGGSAGGNLTLTTALSLLERGMLVDDLLRPQAIYSICPSACMLPAMSHLPRDLQHFERPNSYGDAAAINKDVVLTCGDAYTGTNNPANPLISPIFHPKLANLPPVYITTSDKDPLQDDAEMLQHRLTSLGVEVVLKRYNGYPHFFHVVPGLKMTQKFNEDLSSAIRAQCMFGKE